MAFSCLFVFCSTRDFSMSDIAARTKLIYSSGTKDNSVAVAATFYLIILKVAVYKKKTN